MMAGNEGPTRLAEGELASLLEKTSRTFALAIPVLGEPLATDVGLAYLLFRIADTLEDATAWRRDARVTALASFGAWLEKGDAERGWASLSAEAPPVTDAGCLELLARASAVRASVIDRGEAVAGAVLRAVSRTSDRMAAFAARQTDEGAITLSDMPDLEGYCYAVAGIVGELLTDLFALREPTLAPSRDALMHIAPAFGEGLQLVNILKDAPSDAREGRVYVPESVGREAAFTRARADLTRARDYVVLLERGGASRGTVAFCELPRRLAEATLDRLEAGAPKLARDEVMRIFADVMAGA